MTRGQALRRLACCFAVALITGAIVAGSATGQPAELDEAPMVMTLEELEGEIERREADLRRYSEQLQRLERQIEALRTQLAEREAVLRRQERTARTRVVTLCRLSRGGYVQLLRGARNWTDLVRRAQIARVVMDQDVAALQEHQREVEELSQRRQQLTQRVDRQRELQERIARYQRELEAERARRLAQSRELQQPQSLPVGAQEDDITSLHLPLEL